MAREQDRYQEQVVNANTKTTTRKERAERFRSLPTGKCAAGAVQSSFIERRWAAHQPWAMVERPDHNFGPVLTDFGRRQMQGGDHAHDAEA